MERSTIQSIKVGQRQFGFTPKLRSNFDRPYLLERSMKNIQLTQGKVALVDDEDFERINRISWHAHFSHGSWYANGKVGKRPNRKCVHLHRVIMGLEFGDERQIDHINHDGLDNRKCNLRICNNAENNRNKKPQVGCGSLYKGVWWNKRNKKWIVGITYNYKQFHIGCFDVEIEAAKAYDIKAKELFGEFANTNFKESEVVT